MMTTFADSTSANFSVQGFLDDVVKTDQIDENGFRTSKPTPNLKQSVTTGELHSNKILIENSEKNRIETNKSLPPLQANDEHRSNKIDHLKKDVPLLQRLKVVNTSKDCRVFGSGMPLPKEVIVENHDDSDVDPGAFTAFSELAVDGMLSISTIDKRTPMKFTFDGIVPSRSSLDENEIDVPPGFEANTREFYDEDMGAPAFLEGLEYELDDVSEPSGVGHEELLKGLKQESTERRERCESTNTDLSIELSESQYLRNCEETVEEKYKIFSPVASFGRQGNQIPIDHGFDVIPQHEKDDNSKKNQSLSSWIDLSFLGLW